MSADREKEAGPMRFDIREDKLKKRFWRLQNGKAIANSGKDRHDSDDKCKRAIRRIKANVAKAPVDPARSSGFHFKVEVGSQRARWRLLDGKKEVGVSSSRFATPAAAKKAIKQFQTEAPLALLPIVHTFQVEERFPTWGLPLTLQALVPPTFGGADGLVFLQGATQRKALHVDDWETTPGTIIAALPATPLPGPHFIAVETSLGAGQIPITILNALVFRVLEPNPGWGLPVTLERVPSSSFSSGTEVALLGPVGQQEPLAAVPAPAGRLSAVLPKVPPFPGPYQLEVKSVTGPNPVRGVLALDIADVQGEIARRLRTIAADVKLEPKGPVPVETGNPTLPVAMVNPPPKRISLPVGDYDVTAEVGWSLAGPHHSSPAWSAHQATETGARFSIVPRLVDASVLSEPTAELDPATIAANVRVVVKLPGGLEVDARAQATLTIQIRQLQLPTCALFFTHNHFQPDVPPEPGCVFVYLKPGSVDMNVPQVLAKLTTVRTALATLSSVFDTVPWTGDLDADAGAISMVVNGLVLIGNRMTDPFMAKGHKVRVGSGPGHRLLSESVRFWTDFLYTHTGEDTFGAMALIGRPGECVRVYGARNYHPKEGDFVLHVLDGHIVSMVENLHGHDPAAWPDGALQMVHPAPGDATFGDKLSSLHWGPERPD
jgi:hypothetical protein